MEIIYQNEALGISFLEKLVSRSSEVKNREKRVKFQYLFSHVYSKKICLKSSFFFWNFPAHQAIKIWLSAKFYVFEQYAKGYSFNRIFMFSSTCIVIFLEKISPFCRSFRFRSKFWRVFISRIRSFDFYMTGSDREIIDHRLKLSSVNTSSVAIKWSIFVTWF